MDEMIERVTDAILKEAGLSNDPKISRDAQFSFNRSYARRYARAAIEAMREPTERMMLIGADDVGYSSAARVWDTMIDAALSDQPPSGG